MTRKFTLATFALLAATGLAFAQDDTAGELDDAAIVAVPGVEAGGLDDADLDTGSGLAGAQAASGSPIAFGVVTSNGTKYSGTLNFSSSYNSTYKRYEISITGQSYYYLNYATLITPAGDSRFCKSSSVGGKLLVYCYNSSGQVQQSRFGFVTFKP